MAVLSEEQTMLRDMAREWTSNESPVGAWRKVRDADASAGYDANVYGEMAGMGWTGIIVPEAHGGSDFGWLSLGLVIEELGKTVTASPIAASAVAASAIIQGGSRAQKATYLPRIANGELVATVAAGSAGRFDGAVAGSARGGAVSGSFAFVAEGDSAGLFVVDTDDGLYLVEAGDGVDVSRRVLTDMRSHAAVTFDGAAGDKLADGGDGLRDAVFDRAAILAAAEMLGLAGQAFDTTLAYLKQRVQFGQVLATFQALQHRMAQLFSEIELMRSAVEAGLAALDHGGDTRLAASLAKCKANEVGHAMSREMVQLHGGIGMTDEYDAGFYLKRMRVLEQMWGNASYHRDRFARLSGF